MKFEFATASRIIFGPGSIVEVAPLAVGMGKFAFVITGNTVKRAAILLEQLSKQKIKYITFSIPTEPTTTLIKKAMDQARQAGCDLVISIGGGSVIDTGKAVAAMLTNAGQLEDYLEVVGLGKPLTQRPAPHIAIPTTAGTGAEVTRNSVLSVPEHKVKVSMRSHLMLPTVAVVDLQLTYSLPPAITASTGLDTLTQLIEAYVSIKANPLTDGICIEGIERAARSLRRAYEDGSDSSAREDMSLASLFSGLALANAGLGTVHGFAGPLGGMIAAPHGVICARFLPHVIHANISALQSRTADSKALARYDKIAQILTGRTDAKAADGLTWLQQLCSTLKVPSLTTFGLKEKDFPTVIAKAKKASSMKANPIVLTDDELLQILSKASGFSD